MTQSYVEEGIYAASLIPMHEDLSCDDAALFEHCKDLIERGCRGVVLFGTTGEGASFSTEEKIRALKALIQAGLDPHKVILASGGCCVSDAIVLAKTTVEFDCAAFLVCPPTFYKAVPEEGVLYFYRELMQRVQDPRLKVLLYHIPQFTGVPLSLKVIETLAKEFPETVIGLKESEGNMALAKDVVGLDLGLKVFVGHEKEIIGAVGFGAAGSICGIANLYPELICSLFKQGKKGPAENPDELVRFLKAKEGIPFIQAFKAIMEKRKGSAWHPVRPPLIPLSEKERVFCTHLA